MLDETAKGVFTIAVTPFTPDGALDLDSVDSMVDFYVEKRATGLTILGIMGEAGKLSAAESEAVIKRVVAAHRPAGDRRRLAAGFAPMQALAASAMDAGAAGVMVAPPHTLRHRRPDHRLLPQRRRDAGRHALGAAGLSAGDQGGDADQGDPADRRRLPDLRDAEARGLAGP